MKLGEKISRWIKERIVEAKAKGAVLGLSGGLDSAVVAALLKKALEADVLGLIMRCHSNKADEYYADLVAKQLNIKTEKIVLDPIYDKLREILPAGNKIALANIKARLRMLTLYYFANNLNYLVVGTGNKSEIKVGYFTKYGDGGVDILPIGGLLKAEVKKLAKELNIPQEIIDRVPTAGLWTAQTEEGELGITYDDLDRILKAKEEGNLANLDLDNKLLSVVEDLINASEHKRKPISVFIDIED